MYALSGRFFRQLPAKANSFLHHCGPDIRMPAKGYPDSEYTSDILDFAVFTATDHKMFDFPERISTIYSMIISAFPLEKPPTAQNVVFTV